MISKRSSYNKIKRNAAGQTLIIALMVMFAVSLVAAVFIGLVARNLFRSERYSNIDVVSQISEAGIKYADKMLTSSEEGADWRPIPDNVTLDPGLFLVPTDGTGLNTNWQEMRDKYPDYRWVRPYYPTELPTTAGEGMGYAGPTGGYTTFNTGQGRFLLRISYKPNMRDPLSKYIKIESIGRLGVFDENDPTTYKPYGNISLRREITAYKPIGVTDYLRFITNKDNRNTKFALGCPGYNMKFGRAAIDSKFGMRGAPIRVNGNLMWYGAGANAVQLCLRGAGPIGDLTPIDKVEVAGEIFKDGDPLVPLSQPGVSLSRLGLDGVILDTNNLVTSDIDTGNVSWTVGGFIRDSYPSASEPTRRIKRIEPPLVDQPGPTNTTTRYRLLTLNSGERVNVNNAWVNLGELGWGRGIYIGNTNDKQSDSETLYGGLTVRSDWLQPNNPMSICWKGSYYIPPGVVIALNPGDTDDDGQDDISITRTDSSFSTWYDAWGEPRPEWGHTVIMPYPNANTGRTATRVVNNLTQTKMIDGNGVIYAEGNIRIKGMLPKGVQLTIVSGQNIYIEGNLLKNRDLNWTNTSNGDPYRGADATGGLALLAQQNVCVNTTQFFTPQDGLDHIGSDAQNGQPPYHMIVSGEPDSRAEIGFDLGPWESENGDAPFEWFMLLRHSGQYGTSYINAWLNPGDFQSTVNGLLRLNTAWRAGLPVATLPSWVWGIGDPAFNAPGWGIDSAFIGEAIPLIAGTADGQTNANLITVIGEPNMLRIALDQTTFTRNNYLLGGVAIQPFDVRIEAVIYAQEGSFFVLPGNWFNPNEGDTQDKFRPAGVADRFPYYGQPLDIRIIIDGAISENVPAAIGDVEEWMAKWGTIPAYYGISDIPTAHPGEGLAMLYDDHVGWPLTDPNNAASQPIRADIYGRVLPIAPRLPVSGSLIYFGDGM
ncbi:MAG: hypothetical protein NT018_07365 [Armatimonadetes bacterium]|nr:hypothetical protein [Armatimonadota bacterium]